MKLNYKYSANEIGGNYIAVPVGDAQSPFNGFIKLNETGAYIFDQLQEEISEADLVSRVVEKFGCDTETAAKNVDYIVSGLRKANLLTD